MVQVSTIKQRTDIKQRAFDILEVAIEGDSASKVFDVFIMALIILNVTAVVFETVESLSAQYALYFRAFEVFSVAIFTVEYILRVWTSNIAEKFRHPVSGRIRFLAAL